MQPIRKLEKNNGGQSRALVTNGAISNGWAYV